MQKVNIVLTKKNIYGLWGLSIETGDIHSCWYSQSSTYIIEEWKEWSDDFKEWDAYTWYTRMVMLPLLEGENIRGRKGMKGEPK